MKIESAHLKKTTYLILAVTSLVTVALMMYSARPWDASYGYTSSDLLTLLTFTAWALSPFIALAIIARYFSKKRMTALMALIGSGVNAIGSSSLLLYYMLVLGDEQAGLMFMYLPVYQWIGSVILLALCIGVNLAMKAE